MPGAGHGLGHAFGTAGLVPPDDPPPDDPPPDDPPLEVEPLAPLEPLVPVEPAPEGRDGSPPDEDASVAGSPFADCVSLGPVVVVVLVAVHALAIDAAITSPAHANDEKLFAMA